MMPSHPSPRDRFPAWWITQAAFLLALAMVIARVTTVDALRDPWDAVPGSGPVSHGPGPATALVYDLLMVIPALLVLLRRSIDGNFRLTARWSGVPMFLLAGWAVLSTVWSADKFAAAVTSAHLLASACLLWAMSQLVRSWVRFRLVAAVSFGLLLMLVAQSLMYKYVDVPENLTYWNEKKTEILKQHGWEPDSFAARQFEHKVTSGETAGFFTSPNTLAAVGVLLFAACVGIGVQKLLDGEDQQWLVLPIVAAVAVTWLLIQASSKTSAATPFVGCAIIALFVAFQEPLRKHSATAFAAGVGFVVLCLAAVVGVGVVRHGLFAGHFSNSLDFRWKYWVASAGVFITHPLVGVGWSNFGMHYLAHRLPEAAEEIKDPHNFLVRVFVELGLVGGVLLIAWLLRVAWELTRPGQPVLPPTATLESKPRPQWTDEDDSSTILSPAVVVIVGMLISTIASTDFGPAAADVLTLLLRPMLLALTLLLGTMGASMLNPHSWQLDTRPAPWIFYCVLTGLGLFLLHNLIDFSWFEPGAMAPFMMLIGATLGMAPATSPSKPTSRIYVIAAAVAAFTAWALAAMFFVVPIILAEDSAASANDSITTAPTDRPMEYAAHFRHAADLLASAGSSVPYNAAYPFRQANASLSYRDLAAAEALIRRAIQINPLYVDAYLLDANMQLKAEPRPDVNRVHADFDTIIRLNPNDVSLHIQYGRALESFGQRASAAAQFELAIKSDAALPEGEPKRLTADQLADLREHLRQNQSAFTK